MNLFSKLSTEELLECYAQWDRMQHHTGVCKDGLLREIIDAYDEAGNEGRAPVRAACEDLLEEIARRWAEDNRAEDFTKLKHGSKVWYVDYEASEVEPGEIYLISFKDGVVDSFSVNFENGDFDEFVGSSLEKSFFASKNAANDALIKGRG